MTFTYNLNKSQLENYLAQDVNPQTQSLIEAALTINGLQPNDASTMLTTTIVDAAAPHTFDASTTGFSNFTTNDGSFSASGQLFIADAPALPGSAAGSISVTDSDGGNIFAIGTYADNLTVTNNGAATDTVYGGGNYGESITLGAGNFLAVAGADVRSTITGGSGADNIYGGAGARTYIEAGSGNNTNVSGDTSASAAYSFDTLVAGTGTGQVLGVLNGTNQIWGSSIGAQSAANAVANTLWGGNGADTLYGGGLSVMQARNGADDLQGGRWSGSADTLIAGDGNDTLSAWAGDNTFYGYNTDATGAPVWATGSNTIWTGSGNDTVFGGGHSLIITDSDANNSSHTLVDTGLFASSADTIVSGGGHDTIMFNLTGSTVGGGAASDATIVGGSNTTLDVVGLTAFSGASTSTSGNSTTITFTNGSQLTYSGSVSLGAVQATPTHNS